MNMPSISLSELLERIVSEGETADGRTVRLCRDPNGGYWVVDRAERIVPLREFAMQPTITAREFRAVARAETVGRIAERTREALARIAQAVHWMGARVARA